MEQNPIRYQDLIAPDDSIEKLIGQLEQLQESYKNMADSVKSQAQQVADGLSKVSGATEQGRKKIKESSEETKRLEKAYKQLDAALGANAKEIARLNTARREMNNYNKLIVQRGKEEIRTMQQIESASYKQLSAQYSLNKAYINSLSIADRRIAKNKELIRTTKEIYEQMKRLQADTGKMQLNVGNYPQFGGLLGGAGGKYMSGLASGLVVALVSPVMAFLLGIAPQILTVPAIMAGNTVYVVLLRLIAGADSKATLKQIAAWAVAAIAKFATLYLLVAKLICGVMAENLIASGVMKPPMVQALPATFSWPQLFTALIGGAVALVIVPVVRKALHR